MSFVWTPYDPSTVDPAARLQSASPEHLFGTDKFGRDTLTWVMYGARITLMVGVVAVGIAVLIGTPIGIIAAVFAQYPWGVWLSAVIMRANDILLAFPALLLAIVFAAVYQPGQVRRWSPWESPRSPDSPASPAPERCRCSALNMCSGPGARLTPALRPRCPTVRARRFKPSRVPSHAHRSPRATRASALFRARSSTPPHTPRARPKQALHALYSRKDAKMTPY